MAYNLGTARGIIEIIYKPTGVKQAEKDLKNLGDTSTKGSSKMQSAGNVMAAAGAGIAAGLLAAVDQAAKFEQRIDVIGAVSGETGEIMEKVRQKALQLGNDTVFSATESADAMGELVKAGLSVDEVLGGAADATVALAAAGEIDLTKAATIASNAMNQFGKKASEMPKVADTIAGAANASAISVHQFGLSLSQVGAVANLVGFSFEDTATAIAVLGDAGIRGSDAGTSLKTMFINLIPQTKRQIQMFEDLGLSQFNTTRAMEALRKNGVKPTGTSMEALNKQMVALSVKQSGSAVGTAKQAKAYAELTSQTGVMANQFFDAQGKVKPMNEVFATLAGAMKNLTKEEQIKTLSTIFGTDAIRASAIAAQLASGGFDQMAKDMSKVTAANVASERLNNLKGDLEKLKGSLQTGAIIIGTVLIPALRDFTQMITKLLNKFAELSPQTQENITKFFVWSAAILLAGAAVIKLIGIVQSVIGVVRVAASGIQFLAAVIRLNGAMALLMAKSGALAAASWVRASAAAAVARVRILATAVAMRVSAAASAVWAAVTNVLSVANLRAAASWVATTAAMVAHRVALIAGAVATAVMTGAQAALNVVMSLNPFALVVIAIIALVAAFIYAYKHSETFRKIVDGTFQAIKIVVMAVVNVVKTVVVAVWNFLVNVFRTTFNAYKTIALTVWNFISNIIRKHIEIAKAVVSIAVNFIKSRWELLKALVGIAVSAFTGIVNAIRGRISAVISAVSGIVSGIVNKIRGLRDALVGAGRDAIQGLINGITGMFGAVMDKARSLANSVKDTIKNALKIGSPSKIMDTEVGMEIGAGMIVGMEKMHDRLRQAAAALAMVPIGTITGSVNSPLAPSIPAGAGGGSGNIIFEAGAISVTALPGMNEAQVGEFTMRRISTGLATRTQTPRVAQARG